MDGDLGCVRGGEGGRLGGWGAGQRAAGRASERERNDPRRVPWRGALGEGGLTMEARPPNS